MAIQRGARTMLYREKNNDKGTSVFLLGPYHKEILGTYGELCYLKRSLSDYFQPMTARGEV